VRRRTFLRALAAAVAMPTQVIDMAAPPNRVEYEALVFKLMNDRMSRYRTALSLHGSAFLLYGSWWTCHEEHQGPALDIAVNQGMDAAFRYLDAAFRLENP